MNDFDQYKENIDAMSLEDLYVAMDVINKEYGKAWKYRHDTLGE